MGLAWVAPKGNSKERRMAEGINYGVGGTSQAPTTQRVESADRGEAAGSRESAARRQASAESQGVEVRLSERARSDNPEPPPSDTYDDPRSGRRSG